MNRIDIKDLAKDELKCAMARIGEEPYRASQVFGWLYKDGVHSFEDMTSLSKPLREKLKNKFHITKLVLLDSKQSLVDGTAKYLFKLEDGNTIESVYLPEPKRTTLCLSTQVGCKFGCSFCASAPFGFIRDLKASEILDQVLTIKGYNKDAPVTNIVFMGIGEPLDNYDNLLKAIRILNDPEGFGIGARKMTVSTCGIIPGIERLAGEKLQIELSVSLHSADDDIRSELIPVNKKYPLKELIAACKDYVKKTNRIITFEYVLIKGVNCSADDAVKLATLLKGLPCKINTISYNQVRPVRNCKISNGIKAKGYDAPDAGEAKDFMRALKTRHIDAIMRKSKGEDIDAGCGQLRISKL
jgi:23S rRNA (adenine2503-C2)-methyltransferase